MRRPPSDIWRKRAVNWLSLVVLGVVVGTFGVYLQKWAAEAEAMSVRVALNNLRSQLAIEENTARARLDKGSLDDRSGANPMDWVERPPGSYTGDCANGSPGDWGSWCFDTERGTLRYYPRFGLGKRFERAFDGEAYIWRVEVTDRDHLQLVPGGNSE